MFLKMLGSFKIYLFVFCCSGTTKAMESVVLNVFLTQKWEIMLKTVPIPLNVFQTQKWEIMFKTFPIPLNVFQT